MNTDSLFADTNRHDIESKNNVQSVKSPSLLVSITLLFVRLFIGILMLTHAIDKITHFGSYIESFPDLLGLGSGVSLFLATAAETVCSVLIIMGIATRWAALLLMLVLGVALFLVHAGEPFSQQELPLLYLGFYMVLFLLGGGRFGFGRVIQAGLTRERELKKAAKEAEKREAEAREAIPEQGWGHSCGISLFEEGNQPSATPTREPEENESL